MAATTTTTRRMAMRMPQPSANLFILIMLNCELSFFQDWSDLRSDYLPLIGLLHKCVSQNKFSAEKILLSLLRFKETLADHDSSVAIQANPKIVNFEFGENDVAVHAFQIASFIHDPAVWPNDGAIVRFNTASV